ncbi:O-antigen ligase family protein [Aeromonas veronii]|uniref:O-antigen ligase family protein n=1 Tax=Aeromonas veronii TaxID=654 RepID=UPI003D1FA8B9
MLVNRFFKHLSLPYLITLIASTFLSFSRLPFMLSIVLLAIFILLSANIYLKILVVTCLCFLISVKYDGILNYFDSYIAKLINVLSYDDYGNSIRIELWSEAFSKLLDYEFYLGHGFGSSNLNISRQLGTTYLGHFESTFFYYFIELGLFGVMLFLFAFFKSISACQTIFEKMVIIMFFANICVVPLMVNYQLPFVFWLSVALLTVTKTNQRIFIYEK